MRAASPLTLIFACADKLWLQRDGHRVPSPAARVKQLPMFWQITFLALPLALLVDRLLGDPAWLWSRRPHPVVLCGRLIETLERHLNDLQQPPAVRQRRGVGAVLTLVLLSAAAGMAADFALSALPPLWHTILEASVASILLAHRSLTDHVSAVARALDAQGTPGGRAAVATIVGRDVSVLDEAGITRAAIESAAENFSDGLVAPVFWYALLGLPGLLVFKTISTADSMIGHRSPRYEAFGWAAARLDDVLSFVPARLSALLIVVAAVFTGGDSRQALRVTWRDARLHRSPNAGWPEAAAAGALGLALGGPRRYGGHDVDGAWLNPEGRRDASARDIVDAIRLIDVAWAILFAIAVLIAIWIAL